MWAAMGNFQLCFYGIALTPETDYNSTSFYLFIIIDLQLHTALISNAFLQVPPPATE